MHELSIAEGIIKSLEKYRSEHPGTIIKTVMLDIGKISGVNSDALLFAFPLAAEAGGITAPELSINVIPVSLSCHACSTVSELEEFEMRCVKCGSDQVTICAGRELKIRALEIIS